MTWKIIEIEQSSSPWNCHLHQTTVLVPPIGIASVISNKLYMMGMWRQPFLWNSSIPVSGHSPIGVTFRTTDPTLSLSLLETLHRRIVDHQTLPVVRSLFLSGQFLSWPESVMNDPPLFSLSLHSSLLLPSPWPSTCTSMLSPSSPTSLDLLYDSFYESFLFLAYDSFGLIAWVTPIFSTWLLQTMTHSMSHPYI